SDHGLVRTLYDESPEILRYLEEWTAPTKVHTPGLRGNFLPVPAAYEHGLPEMQTQHTCILLQDLLDHCNLKCPTCFAESARRHSHRWRRWSRCWRRSTAGSPARTT